MQLKVTDTIRQVLPQLVSQNRTWKLIPQDLKIYITCLATVALIFLVDINLPLGVAGGVPYVAVILITLRAKNERLLIYFAVICSMMVVLGYYGSPAGGEAWQVLLNRALAIFAIWVTAILVFKWKAQSKEILDMKNKVAEEKEKIYLATIYSSQHIINNLLNQLQYIKIIIDVHPEIEKKHAEVFDRILKESALLMIQLSSIKDISEESIKSSVDPDNINLTNLVSGNAVSRAPA